MLFIIAMLRSLRGEVSNVKSKLLYRSKLDGLNCVVQVPHRVMHPKAHLNGYKQNKTNKCQESQDVVTFEAQGGANQVVISQPPRLVDRKPSMPLSKNGTHPLCKL